MFQVQLQSLLQYVTISYNEIKLSRLNIMQQTYVPSKFDVE